MAAFEHPHDEPKSGITLPPVALLWRGAVLGIYALASGRRALNMARRHPLLAAPIYLPIAASAALSAWAAIIHLTGGEKYDDHPEV